MKKQNKQCESCQQFGKGTCNAFKCIVRNYCNWKEIKRPKYVSDCCSAELIYHHGDEGTHYCECSKCGKPCNFKDIMAETPQLESKLNQAHWNYPEETETVFIGVDKSIQAKSKTVKKSIQVKSSDKLTCKVHVKDMLSINTSEPEKIDYVSKLCLVSKVSQKHGEEINEMIEKWLEDRDNAWRDKLSNICRDEYNNLSLDPSEIEDLIIKLIIK